MFRIIIAIFVFALNFTFYSSAQSTSVTDRTPEQEATKQTEKLQKELNLSLEQAKSVYEINLKYARDRQQSNKRAEALERIKKKNNEISRVLTPKQNEELNSKRMQVQSVEIGGEQQYTRTDSRDRIDYQGRNSSSRSSSYTGDSNRPQNRPVRTDFRLPLSEGQNRVDKATRPSERPVRERIPVLQNESRKTDRPTTDRPESTNRNSVSSGSANQSNDNRSSSSVPNNNSRPVRNSGERR